MQLECSSQKSFAALCGSFAHFAVNAFFYRKERQVFAKGRKDVVRNIQTASVPQESRVDSFQAGRRVRLHQRSLLPITSDLYERRNCKVKSQRRPEPQQRSR